MAARTLRVELKYPIHMEVPSVQTGSHTKALLESHGEPVFPDERQDTQLQLESEWMQVYPNGGTITSTLAEDADVYIDIRWKRRYLIDPALFNSIEQASTFTCWATALTIMKSFRDQKTYSIEDVIKDVDEGDARFAGKYQAGEWVDPNEMGQLAVQAGLLHLRTETLSPSWMYKALKENGPLFCVVFQVSAGIIASFAHAVIVFEVLDTGGTDSLVSYLNVGYGPIELESGVAVSGPLPTVPFGEFLNAFYWAEKCGWNCPVWCWSGLANVGTAYGIGKAELEVLFRQHYKHRIELPDMPPRVVEAAADQTRTVSIDVQTVVKPGNCTALPENMTVSVEMPPFFGIDPNTWSGTMTLDGNDLVVSPE